MLLGVSDAHRRPLCRQGRGRHRPSAAPCASTETHWGRPRRCAATDDAADTDAHRIQKFTSTGTYLTQWGTYATGNGQFHYPRGVAVDGDGFVYVADTDNHRIQKFTSTGTYLTQWGTYGAGDGQFNYPWGVAVDDDSNIYVVDRDNRRVQKFTSTGTFLMKWGSAGSGDGQFTNAQGVAVDGDSNVFVADSSNNRIQKFGVVTDTTDPTVDLRTPPEGAVYARNQAVVADFSCADEVGGSGVATCVGTVADGAAINTVTYGSHNFTVTATDNAANTAFDTHSYTVATPLPDGRIKKGSGTFIGNNIYNETGLNQTRSGSAPRGSSVTYTVKVQNDSQAADALRLTGTASNTRFGVTYTVGATNVTAAVVAGTYVTPTLAPGATLSVKVVVKVKTGAPAGSSLTATLIAKSNSNSTYGDTVKFVTRRA